MKLILIASSLLISATLLAQTTPPQASKPKEGTTSLSAVFGHNDRLKILSFDNRPIIGTAYSRTVDGIWLPESEDSSKSLAFPQQVNIRCVQPLKTCYETSVTLAVVPISVAIQEIAQEEYTIYSWDAHGLVASYGGDEESGSKCQRHVLTMDFESGAVSVSDIPTHKKGCEMFKETDSYRLQRGNYYVDTTPGNDADKPRK